MKYKKIVPAKFIKRPNRFIAEVEVNGQKETVHVKNTGRCKELLIPGCDVWLDEP
ncbi:MAG: DNA/RNA nuclease SfsA, partial [Lachnospiraceae bacterium]|nr:DNA/RNA nuclease SfsA [Lachnospiraceae bacterium]